MNESEKERLIKKDIESIENRVRHAFNQGYEMGLKASSSEIPNTCGDAISREELIEALDTWDKFGYAPTNELIPLRGNVDKEKYVPYIHYDDVIESIKGMPSVTKQPCDDAISRQAVLDLAEWFDLNQQHFIVANLIDEVENMPSVSPQQRTGRWIEVLDKIRAEIMDFEEELFHRPNTDYTDYAAVRHCVEIIDKYKAESEEQE